MNSLQLREERAALVDQAGAILSRADKENRSLTHEEERKWEEMHRDIDKMKRKIDELEIQERGGHHYERDNGCGGYRSEARAAENRIFRKWMVGGMECLDAEEKRFMHARQAPAEGRAQSVGTTTAGGFSVPKDFRRELETALKSFGGIRASRATILNTTGGGQLELPTSNDTSNKGALLAENTADAEQDITFGQLLLDAYKYTSRIIRVSVELMQDSAFNMDAFIAGRFAERLARITNEHFTTGDGTGKPNGVVTAATLGKTGAGGQVTSVTYNDLVDLKHSVDQAYRQNAEWMMNDLTVAAATKLVDGDSRPLWAAGLVAGAPDTILGHTYVVNNDMAVMAANAKSILFGDFSKYIIRDVLDVTMARLVERYAEFHQVGFIANGRWDGDLLDAGTNPIKYYQNAAV